MAFIGYVMDIISLPIASKHLVLGSVGGSCFTTTSNVHTWVLIEWQNWQTKFACLYIAADKKVHDATTNEISVGVRCKPD